MSYLNPPPGDAPVVVIKDVGGYVDQYDRQTALYFQTNREVRLHECRSACTLALALPNVCVYPDSLLKFHKAYNPLTKGANDEVSDAMMAAYPAAVRERLGHLTRNYKVLTGSELIRLGIRDCNAPRQPRVMVARARLKENPPENPVSNAFGGLVAALTPSPLATGALVEVASVRAETAKAPASDAAPAPPPTPRQSPSSPANPAPTAETAPSQTPESAPAEAAAPTPPTRPNNAVAQSAPEVAAVPVSDAPVSAWGRHIRGSAPILVSARFSPFPYRLANRN